MRAWADADEAAYRRATLIRSPQGYSDAYIRWAFASLRLHRAVRERGVTGKRLREAGWDRNETLPPGVTEPLSAAEWDRLRDVFRKMKWEIDGDVARPVGGPSFEGGTQGKTSFERVGRGWMVVLSDPLDAAPGEHLRQFAQGWSTYAVAIDAATEKVKAGELRTIREVNDFLDAQRKKSSQD